MRDCEQNSRLDAHREISDTLLREMKEQGRHPILDTGMTVRDAFRRVGADEWDAVSERFRAVEPPAKPAQAAE